jgi:hypothetical protein
LYFAEGCVIYSFGNGKVGKTGFAMTLGRAQSGDTDLAPFSIEQDTQFRTFDRTNKFRHLDSTAYGLKAQSDGGIWAE